MFYRDPEDNLVLDTDNRRKAQDNETLTADNRSKAQDKSDLSHIDAQDLSAEDHDIDQSTIETIAGIIFVVTFSKFKNIKIYTFYKVCQMLFL